MARFAATISNSNYKDKSSYGSKSLSANVRGWKWGIKTTIGVCEHTGKDVVYIWETKGTYGDRQGIKHELVAIYREDEGLLT